MQAIRRIHLWVGVILSLVLLCEGLTGLVLTEPAIFGQSPQPSPDMRQGQVQEEKRQVTAGESDFRKDPNEVRKNSNVLTARALHEGRFGSLNLRWLVALAGIGMAILSITGLYIAIGHLMR